MARFHDGGLIDLELEGLSVKEMVQAAGEGEIRQRDSRRRVDIFDAISRLSVETQEAMRATAWLKKAQKEERIQDSKKRKRECRQEELARLDAAREAARIRLRTGVTDTSNFMKLPSKEEEEACVSAYLNATSNAALKVQICVICARETMQRESTLLSVEEIQEMHPLCPVEAHPAHDPDLLGGSLLYMKAVVDTEDGKKAGWVCTQCRGELDKGKMPRLALANGMWVGEIPLELEMLSLAEQMLISLYYPSVIVVKLKPKAGKGRFIPDDQVNRGLRGNVSTFHLDPARVSEFIDGSALPRSPVLLSAVIACTLIGPGNVPTKTLDTMFQVRRAVVADALCFLKANHKLYADIEISQERLAALGEYGTPVEILDNIRTNTDHTSELQETAEYVPDDDGSYLQEAILRDIGDCFEQTAASEHFSGSDAEEGGLELMGPEATEEGPDVVELHTLGVVDVNGDQLKAEDVLQAAIAKLSQPEREQGFAVRHGGAHVNEYARRDEQGRLSNGIDSNNPNHLLGAYPCLFPYGVGGFETHQSTPVPYEAHARWAIRYADKRFRLHHSFVFHLFGVLQKRKVAASTKITMQQRQFIRHEELFKTITPTDLDRAAEEEAQHIPYSNAAVRLLKRHITSTRGRVPGTDENRLGLRSKAWGMSVELNPPSVWITLNPSDTHDPIVQVFAGEEIDMDNFNRHLGPDSRTRALRAASDPYAAARFFHLCVQLLLGEVFGITVHSNGIISRKIGILGVVQGYLGTTEAQGRGTLHLHMLLWLQGAPPARKIKELMEDSDFRKRIRQFIRFNIRAHVDGLTENFIAQVPANQALPYSRPADPEDPEYKSQSLIDETTLAATSQYHKCDARCLRFTRGGHFQCKRRAPFELSANDFVYADGKWGPKRTVANLNAWNPTVLRLFRCNNDIKLITNGEDTRNITHYITMYTFKKQNPKSNASALLGKRLKYHVARENIQDTRSYNRKLVQGLVNTLSTTRELSAPEVVSYLMGWGDSFVSHNFVPMYWSSVQRVLRQAFPELREKKSGGTQVRSEGEDQAGRSLQEVTVRDEGAETTERDDTDTVALTFINGRIGAKNQVNDYIQRGDEQKDESFYFFNLDSYEECVKIDRADSTRRQGRPAHTRFPYLPSSEVHQGKQRVQRAPGHQTMPNFMGQRFPRREQGDGPWYIANVLALLVPWRKPMDLLSSYGSWRDAYAAFMSRATEREFDIIENLQYYYECVDSAERDRENRDIPCVSLEDAGDEEDSECDHGQPVALSVTEEQVLDAIGTHIKPREIAHGEEALEIARMYGVFSDNAAEDWVLSGDHAERMSVEEQSQSIQWQHQLEEHVRGRGTGEVEEYGGNEGDVLMLDSINNHEVGPAVVLNGVVSHTTNEKVSRLNEEQRRAFNIVDDHLAQTLRGDHPDQLLMLLLGEGGTGKTAVIEAIDQIFAIRGATKLLAKTATTGVAASNIGGATLHTWTGLGINLPKEPDPASWKCSAQIKARRTKNMKETRYLIVDEVSMVQKVLLCGVSAITGLVHVQEGIEGASQSLPFGGKLNVILVGDFHQFPPAANIQGALFVIPPDGPRKGTEDIVRPAKETSAQIGREIYEQFTTVVILRQQMRNVDKRWMEVLTRSRHGSCTADDLREIQKLVLTNKECDIPNMKGDGWKDATLITPRHGVRAAWNSEAVKKHCAQTGVALYISPAEDTVGRIGRPLTLTENLVKYGLGEKQTKKLSHFVELAIGMKVMVTWNLATAADLSNGTRAIIEKIILDVREGPVEDSSTILLEYPPAVILVRPMVPTELRFEGVPEGLIPISPTRVTFTLEIAGKTISVRRRQLAITPAYAFTDYRSQGQTLEYVFVDIGSVPWGKLSPFNAYVALSRSRGRHRIRLLRDFDKGLFTNHPSQDLRREDERLEELDRITAQRWISS